MKKFSETDEIYYNSDSRSSLNSIMMKTEKTTWKHIIEKLLKTKKKEKLKK